MLNSRVVETTSGRSARKIKLSLMGPAFIAAIGYIDPGNFATNIQAGASFGYSLLWVVVWANVMAMLIQLLSAKLGIATGKNLAEHIRDRFPRPAVWAYWVQAEIIAMATDLAEFIGAAIGFKLLLGVSLLQGAVLTGIATFLILMLQKRGQKPLELVIGGLLLFVAAAYIVELAFSQPQLAPLLKGMALPDLPNGDAVFLAAGVLGATIMPHVIYLHSSLTQIGGEHDKAERYAATKVDVAVAMTIAGFVNLAMMATAAAAFHFSGHSGIADLDVAYLTLQPLLGHAAATVFGLSLVAAGLSSTVVGTLAGAGGDAGVRAFPYSAVAAARGDHAAVVYRHHVGDGCDAHSGAEPGAAQLRHCAGAGAAAGFHRQSGADGGNGQRPAGAKSGQADRTGGGGIERLPVDRQRAVSENSAGRRCAGPSLLIAVVIAVAAPAIAVMIVMVLFLFLPVVLIVVFVVFTIASFMIVIVFTPVVAIAPAIAVPVVTATAAVAEITALMALPPVAIPPIVTIPIAAAVILIADAQ